MKFRIEHEIYNTLTYCRVGYNDVPILNVSQRSYLKKRFHDAFFDDQKKLSLCELSRDSSQFLENIDNSSTTDSNKESYQGYSVPSESNQTFTGKHVIFSRNKRKPTRFVDLDSSNFRFKKYVTHYRDLGLLFSSWLLTSI